MAEDGKEGKGKQQNCKRCGSLRPRLMCVFLLYIGVFHEVKYMPVVDQAGKGIMEMTGRVIRLEMGFN